MAGVLTAFVSNFLNLLVPLAKEEAILILGVSHEIERLRERLEMIQDVLADAERRQFQDRAIKRWLNQLRHVMYDAEDIIDECSIEAEKLHGATSSSEESVNCCFSPFACFHNYGFRHQIGNRIKSLNLRLDDINKDRSAFSLTPAPLEDRNKSIVQLRRRTSPIVDPDIVGTQINDDTRSLVEMITSEHRQKIPVFAIVGMGGVGKTTLAQKIWNHESIKDYFHPIPPAWVCVSQSFDGMKLLRKIIKCIGGDPGESQDKEDLEPLLCQAVTNKKLFLILDDVWDENIWEDFLRKPLQSVAIGSRILVTTRSETVARGMGAVHKHTVKTLSDDDSWSLLCKMVFQDGEERETQNLEDIGKRIVEKCDGLPLAIKTIAGVLRTREKRQSEWENVLRNPAWSVTERPEGVMGALYLSYEDLPPQLKQCFVYLSLYPEDTIIAKLYSEKMWISEGFVEAKGDLTIEEVADEYWKELVWRSLLQPNENYYDINGCTMHDVVLSLTQHLAQDENYCGKVKGLNEGLASLSLTEPCRLHITDQNAKFISKAITERTCLRTLFFEGLENILDSDCIKLRRLRVLDLLRSNIVKLPDSIGNLIHLRFLSLTKSPIKEIPESIGKLRNLHVLNLIECKELRGLPKSITSLQNLRTLSVSGTQLEAMPSGIRALTQLRDLWGFVVSSSSTLEELRSLSQLRNLSVNKLERVSGGEEAKAASLKNKPHLVDLGLRCTPCGLDVESSAYSEEETRRIREVFSELCPPPSLETLDIKGYFGLEYPSWMMKMSELFLPNLRWLDLIDCNRCPRLPLLGLLPQLDYLLISGASAVVSIGTELFLPGNNASTGGRDEVNSYCSFPKLETLEFQNMPNWEEWRWLGEEEGEEKNQDMVLLPCLRTLGLDGCPKLRSLPEALLHHLTNLKDFTISGARNLEVIKNLYTISELCIHDNPNLQRVSDLPALKRLNIRRCSGLRDVERLNQLQYLELEDLEMKSLPEWLLIKSGELQGPLLQKLHIKGSRQLLSRCLVDGPDWPKIRDIPHVDGRTGDTFGYISYTKTPFTFDTDLYDDLQQQLDGSSPPQ